LNGAERKLVAQAHCEQLATAKGPVVVLLPEYGLGEWDREGADLHNKEGLEQFLNDFEVAMPANVDAQRIACHINDAAFADKALEVFDTWRARGVVTG
jgi:uncharacterized protein (UPF0261 family)